MPRTSLESVSFALIAERSNALIAIITPQGEVASINTVGQQLLGIDGKVCALTDILLEGDAERYVSEILPALRETEAWEGVLSFRYSTTGLAVHTYASLFSIPDNRHEGESLFVCTARDRGSDLAHLAHQELMLETVTEIATAILASQSGMEVLEHFAEAARQLTGARYAAIGVATSDGSHLEAFVTVGLTPEEEQAIGKRPRGEGILGLLLAYKSPLRLEDIAYHPSSAGFPANHPPMHAFLGVPIRHGEDVLGSLYLTEKEGGFNEADEVTVNALGAHLAVAIRNLQMLKRQRALVSGLIAAQEEERRTVAYDLHDGLTQYVMAAQMHLSVFRNAMARGEVILTRESLRPAFDNAYKYLTDSVVESRRLINGLRSLALDDMGLVGALEQLIGEEKTRAGWREANFTHNLGNNRFPQALETAVYRIAQEALTNARKHAECSSVQVELRLQDSGTTENQLFLEVRDNGRGFMPGGRDTDYSHIGLDGITERVRLLQGQLEIISQPGHGTSLVVQFPIFLGEEDQQ